MELAKLFIFLILFVSLFSITASAQKTISDIKLTDSDLSDAVTSIEGTFAERRVLGKVVGVHDGDTITVLDADKTQYKIRLNGIDAPELKQDFGNKSKESLSDMVFGKQVTVIYNKIDKYKRIVANVFVDGKDVNLEQIRAGMAWHYKKYTSEQSETDRKTYSEAEVKAREEKKGLWLQPNQTPPWNYRVQLKDRQATEKATRKYLQGLRGGCYYINSNGNKTYVAKKFCSY